MKLSKALKLKNQLAGEVTELKERLGKQNSHPVRFGRVAVEATGDGRHH